MSGGLIACAGAVIGWWLGTGVILFLNHLPRRTYPWTLGIATALMLVTLLYLPQLSRDTSATGLALAFVAALVIWGWLELSYLMGWITGPHTQPCPHNVSEWRRFTLGIQTSLYHELSVLALVAITVALTWDQPNPITAYCCITLWLLRWSAKLNLFLGVSNFNEHWLPEKLAYLGSYMRQRSMNGLFPLSMLAGSAVCALLYREALAAAPGFEQQGLLMVASLLALGILEHAFLMLPVRDSALWSWAIPGQSAPGAGALDADAVTSRGLP